MKFEKLIATFISAIMLAMPMVSAYTLEDYPEPFCALSEDISTCNFLVVAGSDAATGDVVGMTDLAARLAEESYELVAAGGTTTVVSGGKTEDVPLGNGISDGFHKTTMDDSQLAGLLDDTIDFQGTEYDYREIIKFNASTAGASPSIETSLSSSDDDYETNIYMEVRRSSWGYYFKFDESINISKASTTQPLEIYFLGKVLKITSVSDENTFTATVGDEYYMDVGDTVEVEGKTVTLKNVGSSAALVDVDGTTKTISSGSTITVSGVEIKVDSVFYRDVMSECSATLIMGKDAVESYDDGDPYIGQDKTDPDWVWDCGELISNAAGDTTDGSGGPTLGVVFDQSVNDLSDNPATAGEQTCLPNDYACVEFDTLTVVDADYKLLTIEYESDADFSDYDAALSSEPAFHINIPIDEGLWLDSSNSSDNVWIHFNGTSTYIDVFYEDTNNQVQLKGTYLHDESSDSNYIAELDYDETDASDNNIRFKLTGMANTTDNLNLTLDIIGDSTTYIADGADDIKIRLSHSATDFDGLGTTPDANELGELYWGLTPTDISTKDEDHRSLYGIIIKNPKSNGASDRVKLEVPNDEVFATVIVSGPETKVTEAEGATIKKVIPIEISIAKLDTEVGENPGKHLILIGDAAVNSLSAEVMGLSYPTYGASGLFPFSEGEAIIKLYDGVIEEGFVALLVAGWDAEDTRNACSVMQQYGTFAEQLDENEAVIVTSISAAGITAYAEPTPTNTTE